MQDNSSHSTASGSYAAHLRPTEEASQEIADSWRASRNRARDKWFNKKDSSRFDVAELEKRLSESGNHPVYNPDNYPLHMRREQPTQEPVKPMPANPYSDQESELETDPKLELEMHFANINIDVIADLQLSSNQDPSTDPTGNWNDESFSISWSARPDWAEAIAQPQPVIIEASSNSQSQASAETVEAFARILAELGMTSPKDDGDA